MFKSKYKEDALKWREYQEQQQIDLAAEVYGMSYRVFLVGKTKPLVLSAKREGKRNWCYWTDQYYGVYTGYERLEEFKESLCKDAESGLGIEGSFYPSHRIDRIEFGEITKVESNEV